MAVVAHLQWVVGRFGIDRTGFCIRDSQETERHAPPVPVVTNDSEETIQCDILPLLSYKASNNEDMLACSLCRYTLYF